VLVRVAHAQRRLAGLVGTGAGLAAVWALLTVVLAAAPGCRMAPDPHLISWRLEPARPAVGPATLRLTLQGLPADIRDRATVRVVGHMTHPGMTPAVATVTGRGHGDYDAALTFSMPGDWVLLATIVLPDGRRFEQRIDVPGVRARQP
jgi:hypothetical protein